MLPRALAAQHGIQVVPIPVMVDGDIHLEGVDLDPDDFYRRLAAGAAVTTSQPSPGEIAHVYQRAVTAGADGIVSIHVARHLSGTLNSARIAAQMAGVPVELVDSGTASFPVGLSAIAAAACALAGGDPAECGAAARSTLAETRNVFVLSALDFVRGEGRVHVDAGADEVTGIPVVAMRGENLDVLGDAVDVDHACDLMVAVVEKETRPCRIGIGVGGREAFDFYPALRERLERLDVAAEIIEYRCGPSVGAYSGPGVAGMAWTVV